MSLPLAVLDAFLAGDRERARWSGVRHFISGVRPDNAPFLRVNDKLGFTRTGDVVDGEIIFELRRP